MNDSTDDLDLRRRRLAFRARHRGIREMDLILGRFVDDALAGMDPERLSRFEALIDVPDRDLYGWITGTGPVPAAYDDDIMASLKAIRFAATDYGKGA
jgi:antitoxin CptB